MTTIFRFINNLIVVLGGDYDPVLGWYVFDSMGYYISNELLDCIGKLKYFIKGKICRLKM